MAGGLPYNLTTGTTNSGDTGATTDRPVINGVVVGRNTGRGTPVYYVDPFVEPRLPAVSRSSAARSARRGLQRRQPRELRGLQRSLRQHDHATGRAWDTVLRRDRTTAAALAAVFGKVSF